MIVDEQQASEKSYRLHAFRELLLNPAWQEEVEPLLVKLHMEHLEGSTAINRRPEQRAEHIQAFHMAEHLRDFARVRIDVLERELQQFREQQTIE